MVDIRPTTIGDLDAIVALDLELFGPESWSIEAHRDELTNRFRGYLTVTDGRDIVGWGGVILAPVSDLLTIGVARSHQGRGIGARLLDELVATAIEGGAREMFLEVRADDAGAQRLYRRAGFEAIAVRPNYYPATGADAVVMRRDLAESPKTAHSA